MREFLITSHHPLRETLMRQTGITPSDRHSYLQRAWNEEIVPVSL